MLFLGISLNAQITVNSNRSLKNGDVAAHEVDVMILKVSSDFGTTNPYYIRNIKVVKVS